MMGEATPEQIVAFLMGAEAMKDNSVRFEEGCQLYHQEPELMLIEVWHRAPPTWSIKEREDFVTGYLIMRRQRDDYKEEKS